MPPAATQQIQSNAINDTASVVTIGRPGAAIDQASVLCCGSDLFPNQRGIIISIEEIISSLAVVIYTLSLNLDGIGISRRV